MDMMLDWIRTGASVIAMVFSGATFIYVQLDKRQRATVKSIEELKASVDQRFVTKCERLAKLESELNRIPTRPEFDAAQRRVEEFIKGVYDRINEIERAHQDSARETNLLLGQVLGQLKQLSKE